MVDCLKKLKSPPAHFLCASAIGIYENDYQNTLPETAKVGNSFLSNVCRDWEKEANEASHLGIRVVNLRFGLVLSKKGGILKKIYLPFYLGLGGKLGLGNQFLSWISLNDVAGSIVHILNTPQIKGSINVTSKNYVTNKLFTETLAKTLKRPAFFNIPSGLLKLIFGEMAEELFLKSAAAVPDKLLASNYKFEDENLANFLKKELN